LNLSHNRAAARALKPGWCQTHHRRSRSLQRSPPVIARRSLSDPTEIAYYLSNPPCATQWGKCAPADTLLAQVAQVASTRYTVEQCLEEAKGETGLDDYEVRYWHSWYRHITLSMMAHAWLASVRHQATEKKGGLNPSWPP
jgi:SRSO17 transposase